MRLLAATLLTAVLAGCGSVYEMNNSLNDSLSEMMGTYTAPILASYPSPTPGCNDSRCKQLDQLESRGYEMARQKRITWTRFVNAFYEGRGKLYPDSRDDSNTREFISYQRALAEQLDSGKITEAQWAYLVDKKSAEIQRRRAGQRVTCNTENLGSSSSPNYQTVCQ